MLSGTHAAAGRQVSTWAHAVIAGKANTVGGFVPFFHPQSEPETSMIDLCIVSWSRTLKPVGKTDRLIHVSGRSLSYPVCIL
jgi:hypothetical protein